jgi:hypothetical protein
MKVLSIKQITQGVKEGKLQNRDLVYVRHKDLLQNLKYSEYLKDYFVDNLSFIEIGSKTFYFDKTTNEQITDTNLLKRIEYIEDMYVLITQFMQLKTALKQFFEEYNIYPESCLLMELEILDPEDAQ